MDWSEYKFLIVDEAQQFRNLVSATLRTAGAREIRMIDDGVAAIELFERFKPGVVITDWKLEGQDGCRMTRVIRNLKDGSGERVPVVMVSGQRSPQLLQEAAASGITVFLDKPVSARQLLAGIAGAVKKAKTDKSRAIPLDLPGAKKPGPPPAASPRKRKPRQSRVATRPDGKQFDKTPPRVFERPESDITPGTGPGAPRRVSDDIGPLVDEPAGSSGNGPAGALENEMKAIGEPLTPAAGGPESSEFRMPETDDQGAPEIDEALARELEIHRNWVVSGGKEGRKGNFSKTELAGAALSGAELAQADMSGKDLSDADLSEANLQGANLKRAVLAGGSFSGGNLQQSKLRHADMRRAGFDQALMAGADLAGADLQGASLRQTDMTGALLLGTDLRGTDLTAVEGLKQAQLDKAIGDATTKPPPGLFIREPE